MNVVKCSKALITSVAVLASLVVAHAADIGLEVSYNRMENATEAYFDQRNNDNIIWLIENVCAVITQGDRPIPSRVDMLIDRTVVAKKYWVAAALKENSPQTGSLAATIAGNRVTVDCSGVQSVKISLRELPRLLKFPFTVEANGVSVAVDEAQKADYIELLPQ